MKEKQSSYSLIKLDKGELVNIIKNLRLRMEIKLKEQNSIPKNYFYCSPTKGCSSSLFITIPKLFRVFYNIKHHGQYKVYMEEVKKGEKLKG